MDVKAEIGFRIRSLREKKELSQRELSLRADLNRSYIAGIESGARNVSIVNLEKIARALHVTMADFFDVKPFK